jgi:prepilin-type N-terminal cleavage/methylation domain-containing protein
MRPNSGFTLIEVLVALVVAVAAMALLSQGFAAGARASAAAQMDTRAALLAQRVITDLETGALSLSQTQNGTFDDDGEFKYEARCEPDSPGLTLVTVTLTWDANGQERTYVLTRLMRDRNTTTP